MQTKDELEDLRLKSIPAQNIYAEVQDCLKTGQVAKAY